MNDGAMWMCFGIAAALIGPDVVTEVGTLMTSMWASLGFG
jgi:hypothetical protein